MMKDPCLVAVLLLSSLPGQSDSKSVRVPIGYMSLAEKAKELPRLTPLRDSDPMLVLGRRNTGVIDRGKLLDLVSASLGRAGGQKAKANIEGTTLGASCEGLESARVLSTVIHVLDNFVPAVDLEVSVYAAAPAIGPVVLSPGDNSSLPKKALHTQTLRCGAAKSVTIQLGAGLADRVRIRLQPHILTGKPPRIALLCEFQCQHDDRNSIRRWTAGTSSAVVRVGGKMVLSLPGRIIAIRANHKPRPHGASQVVGIPYSILRSPALRAIPRLAKLGPLRIEHEGLPPAADEDVLVAYVKHTTVPGNWESGQIYVDPSRCLLVVSRNQKLLVEATGEIAKVMTDLAAPWIKTATVDCEITTTSKSGSEIARLPTLPGRTCTLLHTEGPETATRGAVLALHWYPDTREVQVPKSFARLLSRGAGELVGFAASLPDKTLEPGVPARIKRSSLPKSGRIRLLNSKVIALHMSK